MYHSNRLGTEKSTLLHLSSDDDRYGLVLPSVGVSVPGILSDPERLS